MAYNKLMQSELQRRHLLTALGAGTAAFAGCIGDDEDADIELE